MKESERVFIGMAGMSIVVSVAITLAEGGTLIDGLILGSTMATVIVAFGLWYAWMLGGVSFLKHLLRT